MSDVFLGRLDGAAAPRIYRWLTDPVVRNGLGLRSEPSLEKTERWLRENLDREDTRPYSILWRTRHVGNIVLDRIDRAGRSARLYVYIGDADARGRGIGAKALRLVLDAAFGELGLSTVWLVVDEGNAAALRLYAAAGFKKTGRVENEMKVDGRLIGAARMEIRSDDRPAEKRPS